MYDSQNILFVSYGKFLKIHIYFFIEQTKSYLFEHIDSTNFPFTFKAFKGNDLLPHF